MKTEYTFVNYIKSIVDLPKDQEEKFASLTSTKTLKKGEEFVQIGSHPKHIGYVKQGIFRYLYVDDKGIEFTKTFFAENNLISSYSAMVENRESYFAIQALENSVIEVVDYAQFSKLFTQHHCWTSLLAQFLLQAFITKEERERQFLLFDAEQRYQNFLNKYPGLNQRVKQHIIASYLGIAPESFSRLKKTLIT